MYLLFLRLHTNSIDDIHIKYFKRYKYFIIKYFENCEDWWYNVSFGFLPEDFIREFKDGQTFHQDKH